jgi:hypothetical protein
MDMSTSRDSRVFILGAGCSVECGYPPGTGFAAEFEKFLGEIQGIPEEKCSRIKHSVISTLKLLRETPGVETVDQLAARIEQDLNDWKRQRGGLIAASDPEYFKRTSMAARQILDAKIATSAMFLAREDRARQTGLRSYKSFITQVLGGPPWEEARKADCTILTFNYDRLFEIAFPECFPTFDLRNHSLYAGDALNSGFDPNFGKWSLAQPTPGRFCFLKMHGSAGWWVKEQREGGREARRYWPTIPVRGLSVEQIEKSIPKECGGPFGWEPLLAFPHERQESQKLFSYKGESSGYDWAPYIDAVWQHAASVVANATKVRVIGYSFNPIDSRHMVNQLLSKATCKKIVIQNKVDVRRNLEGYQQIEDRLDYDPTPFGEYPCFP